ncbi:M24 family metallopeptidase [Ramlibacter sp.]|uniref:M24 family metallopeptidase n=1 Tax=Ramlibacter sp. TaxID=1917967 RepID=UPI002FCB4065
MPWGVGKTPAAGRGRGAGSGGAAAHRKSAWEIGQVERAARYADWGVRDVRRRAWAGATVAETYGATQSLTRKIIREEADGDALATKVIAAAWPAPLSAEPHAIPRLGDRLRPGVACAEIDAAVNAFLDGSGFADFRTRLHRCGHGFGLGNHEPPWLALGSPHVLRENMLVSIEPGLYAPGAGGYRHSDTVLVTGDGYRCLTQSPARLPDLVLRRTTLRHRVTGWAVRRAVGLA